MQEGGTAPQVAKDEQRFVDGLILVAGEEDVIQPETEPVDERAGDPDHVEQKQEDQPFFVEPGGGIFGGEKRAVECAPELAEVVVHEAGYPLVGTN